MLKLKTFPSLSVFMVIFLSSCSLGQHEVPTQDMTGTQSTPIVITGTTTEPSKTVTSSGNISEIDIGKPCNLQNNSLDTHGLQCYFYNSKDANGNEVSPRLGIWIKPNIRLPLLKEKSNHNDWKQYKSLDKKFSFSYPTGWKINDQDWNENKTIIIMTDPNDPSIMLDIEEVPTNSVTMLDRIQDIKKDGSSTIEEKITLNDSEAIRILTAPKTNLLDEGKIDLFFEQPDGYIHLTAHRTGYPSLDLPIEDLLDTFNVKQK